MKIIYIIVISQLIINNQNATARSFATRCNSLYQLYGAKPCSNKSLVQQFNNIQQKINMKPKIPLFTSKKLSQGKKNKYISVAIYSVKNNAIVLNENSLLEYAQMPSIHIKHILYHELRHGQQFADKPKTSVIKAIIHLINSKKLTCRQALEYDADSFAAKHTAKKCASCLKELKKYADPTKPKRYEGYFTQKDFNPLIKEALKCGKLCKNCKMNQKQ